MLLDTNIVSARARRRPPEGLRIWLEAASQVADLCLCFPVMLEIKRGLRMASDPSVAARIRAVVEDLDRADFIYFGMGKAAEGILADMMANRKLKQFWQAQPSSRSERVSHDLMIAATSICYDTPIVTTDGDYEIIDRYHPLPGVYDPLQNRWVVEPAEPLSLPQLHPTLTSR
ncbi:PIN domain-containing protein [Rhizobium leguminosarum]|uniref:type II toxin-antitoxin system VapC family toxin n=1 Tax=Rhizobium leguminosarum TaxID=384 RepID=UPI0024A7EE90|nr:PIN domain-containing protein [Rhizobium leguminosarum]MDI5929078.1 PIN domain-containing protein [Rhizobium leguminosarum]